MCEEPLCARCARHQVTCCQQREVFVTLMDVERIARATAIHDFHSFRPVADPVYLDQDDDPTWANGVFRPDGTRRVLNNQPNGDCVFLGPAGCRLAPEVRPLVCRLFPYDYNDQQIKPVLAVGCPVELLRPGQVLLEVLNMPLLLAEAWRRQLYDEIRAESSPDANRPDLRPAA
jgi:Fe-S-cluster containining protein